MLAQRTKPPFVSEWSVGPLLHAVTHPNSITINPPGSMSSVVLTMC